MRLKLVVIIIFTHNISNILGLNINLWFENINSDYIKYSAEAAEIAWQSLISPEDISLPEKAAKHDEKRLKWQNDICDKLGKLYDLKMLNDTQRRQAYLLCRGPQYSFKDTRKASSIIDVMQTTYSNAEVCIPYSDKTIKNDTVKINRAIADYVASIRKYLQLEINLSEDPVEVAAKNAVEGHKVTNNNFCLRGESDFEKLMAFSSDQDVLKWAWLTWRELVGPILKIPFKQLVDIENTASARNGYTDIGQSWRQELEIPDLKQLCWKLYYSMKPLYEMLHGVARFHLRRYYGDIVPERGLIPAHLLENLWSSNWESLADKIIPNDIDISNSIQGQHLNISLMVKKAEDFYRSLGLPKLTDKLWEKSIFTRIKDKMRCHGTAADMFKDGDFRLLYCGGDDEIEDLYVTHHELGHIYYYMMYETQPGLFRQGANSAFHESIGDAIMLSVMSPQHLHRLRFINDSTLYDTDKDTLANSTDDANFTFDDILLIKQAFNKLPQIPFALALEEYRWRYFEGSLNEDSLNKEYWDLVSVLQGLTPPNDRDENYFDAAAKFHVPDNTPYIRYFLSSFLQHQLFEHLCKVSVFGRRFPTDELPSKFKIHRCDLYGSLVAGKVLKDLMSRGSSQTWQKILKTTTGQENITSDSLIRYYRPLYEKLEALIEKYDIPIGW